MIKYFKNKLFNYSLLIDDNDQECPYDKSNLFTKYSFGWVTRLMLKGYFNGPLEIRDTFNLPSYLKSNHTIRYLDNLNLSSVGNKRLLSKYPLIWHIYKEYIFKNNKAVIILAILITLFSALSPFSLKLFISYIQSNDNEKSILVGLFYCLLLFLSSLIFSTTKELFYWFGMKSSLQVKSSLITAIFEKSLKLSNKSKKRYNSGKITNLMSVDVENFESFFWTHAVDIFLHPIEILVLMVFLCMIVGVSGLVGLLVMLLIIPIDTHLCKKSSDYLDESLKYTDKRSNFTNELINGINFIKIYAWEKYFIKRIEKNRDLELNQLYKRVLYWIGDQIIIQITTALVLSATFTTYSLLGHSITLQTAFTSMSIFANLRLPIINLPFDIYTVLSLLPSCRRIQRFLKCSELQYYNSISNSGGGIYSKDISIQNATFQWDDINMEEDDENDEDQDEDQDGDQNNGGNEIGSNGDDHDDHDEMNPLIDIVEHSININDLPTSKSKFILSNINFNPPSGKLTIICSPVGTGKTSLVSALIGEMCKVEGQVCVPRDISFTSQSPFILNATFRENIIFGKPFDLDRYKRVIEACCLTQDLLSMGTDLIEIGERGINLSGGQKQRLGLARALYSDAYCFILDEPLSAVDPEVASHLFSQAIQGMMSNKTRILVTHQIQFIPNADHIVLIENGQLIQGTYQELKSKGIDFESIMKTKKIEITNESSTENSTKKPSSTSTTATDSIDKAISDDTIPDLIEKSKLIVEEDRSKGSVSLGVYKSYLKSGASTLFIICTFSIFFISELVNILSDFWITIWTEQSIDGKTQSFYIGYYFLIVGVFVVLILARYLMISKITFSSSKNLHSNLLSSISLASSQFFSQHPSGRILARFTKDIEDLDVQMIDVFSNSFLCFTSVLVGIVSIIYISPLMIIPFSILLLFYYLVQLVYRPSARELNRTTSVTLSPIFSLLQECYNGMVTIRSFKQQSRFIELMRNNIDLYLRCFYSSFAVHMWVSLRLELFSGLIVFFASFIALFSENNAFFILSITTAINMTNYLNWLVKQSVDLEVKMNSYERIYSFIQTPPEGKHYLDSDSKLSNWPSNAQIQFNGVEIKYLPTSEPSLKNITFNVNSFEKIGIIGRTGAGKTSLSAALFRMVECSKGSILIDGVDISKIGLYKLRSSLGVVPQDSFIFTGSIRENIDPFNQYSNEQIWDVLEKLQLDKVVYEMPKRLYTKISDTGNELSFGQKQLLSLARVVLKNPKIILIDEGTSGIDYQNAALIKNVISNEFTHSTLLTIAHRLDTVIDSSKILTMDNGQLVEFDTPSSLIQQEGSIFRNLINYQTHSYNESKEKF